MHAYFVASFFQSCKGNRFMSDWYLEALWTVLLHVLIIIRFQTLCSIVTFQLQFVLDVVFDSLDQLLKTAKNVDFNILIWIFSAKCLDSCAILYLATTWRQKTDA